MNIFQKWFGQRIGLTESGFWGAFFGGSNWAQKPVTIDTALQLSTVWACVRLLAGTIATLPLNLYERTATGQVVATRHTLQTLLHVSPNADQTPLEFIEGLVASIALQGMGYALKDINGAGEVSSLIPWDPDKIRPVRLPDGRLVYRTNFPDGTQKDLPPERVFVVKGFMNGANRDVGLSVIQYGTQTFGNALATEETVGRTFANGLTSAGYFQLDNPAIKLDAEKRAQLQAVLDNFAGTTNAGKQILLEAGLSWKPMNLSPKDAEMLAERGFNVEEICRWFQVPPFMIGHTEKTTSWGTGLEQQILGFQKFVLNTYLKRIEEAINLRLLKPEERGRFFAKFSIEGLLRGDSAARAALYSSSGQNGWMNRDEIRELEDWPAIGPKGGGQVFTVQANLMDLSQMPGHKPAAGNTPRETPATPPGG